MINQKYITVHDYMTPQSKFLADDIDGNGLAILIPTTCTITEELNGTYELYMEHPFDEEGRWKLLEIDNIIKANGQLFRIKSRKTKMSSSGEKVRAVSCMHIWYDLADKNAYSYNANKYSGVFFVNNFQEKLNNVKLPNPQAPVADFDQNEEHIDDINWYQEYEFWHSTDLPTYQSDDPVYENHALGYADYKKSVNMVQLIIGTESSVTNVFLKRDTDGSMISPELYRNNFLWSYNWRKEGSQSDAFSITHTVDMIDIEETYDCSNYYTHMYARDNFGGQYRNRIDVKGLRNKGIRVPPHAKLMQVDFQYNADEYGDDYKYAVNNRSRFNQDAHRYFRSISQPKLTLRCNYAELSETDLYKDYIAAKHCNVGDSGTVNAPELGISQTMRVIKKKIDLINPENVEITFGTKLSTITENNYMSQTINKSKFDNIEFFTLDTE